MIIQRVLTENLQFNYNDLGICLITQVVYSISARTGISGQELVNTYKGRIPFVGNTFSELFEHFKKIGIELELYQHDPSEIKEEIEDGQPVIMIIDTSSYLYKDVSYGIPIFNGLFVSSLAFKLTKPVGDLDGLFHAYCICGYSNGTFLVKDSGNLPQYFLVNEVDLLENPNTTRLFTVRVKSLNYEPPQDYQRVYPESLRKCLDYLREPFSLREESKTSSPCY